MPTRTAEPTAVTTRALAPDLARGFMLLFIALANSHYFLSGRPVLGGYPRDGSPLDSAVTWLIATFVDGRASPVFGLLFGYGVAHMVSRQADAGPRAVRRLLWRRSLALVVIGTLHGLLLYAGDILAAYGVLLFLGAWTVRWLLVTAAFFFVLCTLPGDGSLSVSTDPPDAALLPTDVVTMIVERAQAAPLIALLGPVGSMCPFLLGLWAGRRRILEQPERYGTLLRMTAAVGVGVAVLGAQPVSLMLAGTVPVPDRPTLELLGPLHDATGILGGLGYAATVTLLARRLDNRCGRVVEAVAATGQRSMTCYLTQSVIWALVFTPFLLDLSATLTVTRTALLALATWTATLPLAHHLHRSGRRGPFEVLVRRVTYGRPVGAQRFSRRG
ncbi:DUF418 domain-containing protein [Streptomyces sp. NRRL F-5527]|uniref:DUF418 domain-containing protein n=1 Tax=Streptomyces sp. NRRL F-5527 TaxID=1463862 RepID=UPI0004C52188|nr:DUF418 domain-containing protein [Streptomyces sp. NRRL F-5527]